MKNIYTVILIIFNTLWLSFAMAQIDTSHFDNKEYNLDTLLKNNSNTIDSINKIDNIFIEKTVNYDTIYIEGDTIHLTDTVTVFIDKPQLLKLSVNFCGSAFIPYYKFNNNLSENNINIATYKKAHKPTISHSTGIDICLQRKKWSFQLGAYYTRFNENFRHTTTHIEIDTVNGTDMILEDRFQYIEDGDIVWKQLWREIPYTRIDTIYNYERFNKRNYYSYLELPCLIGFENSNNKFAYSLKAGVIFSSLLKAKRTTISVSDKNEIDNNFNESLFRKTNYSLLVGIGFRYSLSSKIDFIAELYYRYCYYSFLSVNSSIKQNDYTTGIKLGLKYSLRI